MGFWQCIRNGSVDFKGLFRGLADIDYAGARNWAPYVYLVMP
jgi:sugar phosphate isomerase/epimerase